MASTELTTRQTRQDGDRPDVRCPMCEQAGGVHIEFLVWTGARYVKGRCALCSAHWSFPDRRNGVD